MRQINYCSTPLSPIKCFPTHPPPLSQLLFQNNHHFISQHLSPKMKIIFLAFFLLLISNAQAISPKDFNYNITSTSIQSNGQAHELLGKLYGNGSIEDSTKLNHTDVFVKSENEHKHELSVTIRKGGGGGGGGERGGGGGFRGGGSGFGKAGAGMRGMRGGHGHHHNPASTIVLPETHFGVPKFALYFSLALTTLFLIY